ncbi:methyltransferase family protein [Streptomyces acidicola]|uniref:methyltransferase family protein n=1 Tax=Streptomyces acidicola TaxID=2596892 RepID=UPI003428B676
MPDDLTAQNIVQLASGYWAAKTLMSANELRVFTALSTRPKTSEQLTKDVNLHPRGAKALLDALVGLGMLEREGDDLYGNTPETDAFLVEGREIYVGGLLDLMGGQM